MGFWADVFRAGRSGSDIYTPRVTHLGASEFAAWADPSRLTAAQMWETQPHFRTVVTFLARNIAQLGLHSFERVGEADRRRDRSSVLARSLSEVDGNMTTFELIFALVGDLALYDRAYWWAARSTDTSTGWMLRRLPPTWVEPVMANSWDVKEYRVFFGNNIETVPASDILAFPGYSPGKMVGSSPTVDALKQTLTEQVEAATYRAQVWKRGGRVSSVIERPDGAPQWSDAARESFREDWYAKFTGKGSRAGGTPILEDGMTLKRIDFSAQEQQFVEAAKLSLVTVASAFHVNPTMIGQNDGANYSNVREFRKMLYGDTLGPLIAQIEARINTFLVPRMGLSGIYVEFNIAEKLQGNFEEQTSALMSATGGPWMTRNEARGRLNLPSLDGGDELIVPLNVIEGGQAAPNDSGSQNRRSPTSLPRVKAVSADDDAAKALASFFTRQSRVVLSRLGADADWWDSKRWDKDLAGVLAEIQAVAASDAGRAALLDAGIDPSQYDEPRTVKFLAEAARRSASSINDSTRDQIQSAIDDDEDGDPVAAASGVFDVAKDSRAAEVALTVGTFAAGFGTVEAARQQSSNATKTWNVTSGNPRASHAAMDGETVGINDTFSNGLDWPGAMGADADEVAGCQCSVTISFG